MVAEFVVTSAAASGGFRTLEASHRFVSSFDPAMVLRDPIIRMLVGPMFRAFVQFGPDRARAAIVSVSGDTRGNDAAHGLGRSKERLRPAAMSRVSLSLTWTRGAGTIDRAGQIAPSAIYLDARLVNVPAFSDQAVPSPMQTVDRGGVSFASGAGRSASGPTAASSLPSKSCSASNTGMRS
jgi:hypothetical protein